MKIAVSSTGSSLDATVHPLFGRCDFFLMVDMDTDAVLPIKNEFRDAASGAGTGCARTVIQQGVEAVISGQIGPNAYEAFKAAGVALYTAPPGITVREALARFNAGSLQKMEIKRF
jgi:predicted Fe-Mo cluster-binding NifX family protein